MDPSWQTENEYWANSINCLAGIDEVGMGALAGPVVAAAAVFKQTTSSSLSLRSVAIRDSKTLSVKQREKAAAWIKENASAWAIGEAGVEEITALNIRAASHLAMRRAIEKLKLSPDLLLIDGTPAQIHSTIPAINIVDGDAKCFSIAAASILAKVYRDQLMSELDHLYPQYGFASHKGYGTQRHLAALRLHGVSPYHRSTYQPVAQFLTKSGN